MRDLNVSNWAADLAEMGFLSIKMLNIYYVIGDAFTKYTCVKSLKDEKGKTIINAFIKMINESNRKPDKSWVAQEESFTI